jgi:hypothetical protein
MRRILDASNAIKTIYNEIINFIKLHYLLFEFLSTRPKFDVLNMLKGHWQPKFLLFHLKEHEKISRLAV